MCLTGTMSSGKVILKLWKIQHYVPSKLAIAVENRQKPDCHIDDNYLSECLIYKAKLSWHFISEQKLKYRTVVYVKVTCWNRRHNKFDNN